MYREIVHFTAKTMGAPAPRSLPVFAAKLALGGGLVKMLLSSVRCRNGKAREAMEWTPRHATFREGIVAEVAKWQSRNLAQMRAAE